MLQSARFNQVNPNKYIRKVYILFKKSKQIDALPEKCTILIISFHKGW